MNGNAAQWVGQVGGHQVLVEVGKARRAVANPREVVRGRRWRWGRSGSRCADARAADRFGRFVETRVAHDRREAVNVTVDDIEAVAAAAQFTAASRCRCRAPAPHGRARRSDGRNGCDSGDDGLLHHRQARSAVLLISLKAFLKIE